jgi:hypothetical protein
MAEGDERPRVIAEFADYDGMLAGVRTRVAELNVNGEAFDDYAGLPIGYLSKLIGIRPVRRIAMTSMGPLFDALGVRCVMIENPVATERLKNHLPPRNTSYVRAMPADACMVLTPRMLKRIRRLGGQARMARLTAKQRRKLARRAALARWR